jgi:hypothetical protein
MNYLQTTWRLWAKAIGEKAHKKDHVADKVAILRTIIFTTYLVTNCFIVAGVIRHWNDKQTINIEIYETSNSQQNPHTERWDSLGMDGNTRVENVYHTSTVKTSNGEFE